ncbi:MAG: hypothetical protein HY403_05305 [Elusimicrobia bacterium]|nr:hypothetical protein [Elusimicrobiota bacterium]
MAEEPKKDHPEDIESILSDLDAILTDVGGAQAVPKPEGAPKAPPKPEAPVEPPREPPKPAIVELPKEPPKPAAPAEPPKANPAPIELSPREPAAKPPEKKPEPPKASPAPAAAPVPAPPAAPAKAEDLPPGTPREQIRRVAYVCTSACSEEKKAFAAFLSQAARTISKKPLFLREVLSHEVSAASDPNAVLEKALKAKAVAVLALIEGWPPAKTDELSEACSRANLLFRAVAPGDAQKKSTAVDIIVDMMLLPGEG